MEPQHTKPDRSHLATVREADHRELHDRQKAALTSTTVACLEQRHGKGHEHREPRHRD